MTEDVAQLARETRSSIELDRDAKGVYRWSAKVYFDAEDPDDKYRAIETIRLIDGTLREVYL